MSFDDGILTVYGVSNTAAPGHKPVQGLTVKDRYYYGYDNLGVTRYYTALQADQEVAAVVNIPGWAPVKNTDVVIMDEQPDIQYQIDFIQPGFDDNGLRITKLTLGRLSQRYEIPQGYTYTSSGGAADSNG